MCNNDLHSVVPLNLTEYLIFKQLLQQITVTENNEVLSPLKEKINVLQSYKKLYIQILHQWLLYLLLGYLDEFPTILLYEYRFYERFLFI